MYYLAAAYCLLPAACCLTMTSSDRNDLMPAQEKLEWVKPKISLMKAGETDGKRTKYKYENFGPIGLKLYGPS
jgi:hypothetical protein